MDALNPLRSNKGGTTIYSSLNIYVQGFFVFDYLKNRRIL